MYLAFLLRYNLSIIPAPLLFGTSIKTEFFMLSEIHLINKVLELNDVSIQIIVIRG